MRIFERKKATEEEIFFLIKQLQATKEVTYIDDRSYERVAWNSPSMEDTKYTQEEVDEPTRNYAQWRLRRIGVDVVPHLLKALLEYRSGTVPFTYDFHERASQIFVKLAKPGTDIYPQLAVATQRTQDIIVMETLLRTMYAISPHAAANYCAQRVLERSALEKSV